jgi:LysM repeat protein
MTSRSPRRWLAPVALAGAAVAILVTVSAGGGSSGGDGAAPAHSTPAGTTTSTAATATTTTAASTRPRTYTVATGDVLSTIAAKSGVSLARIEQLNPTVDAQALHAGQTIKLAP